MGGKVIQNGGDRRGEGLRLDQISGEDPEESQGQAESVVIQTFLFKSSLRSTD